jgi:pimeloyl-ACP methyl ester carboxylesterase
MRMNIVLVHGAWADGSSWRGVIGRLQQAGHNVTAPQFPLTTLADNVARLRQVLAVQDGPTVVAPNVVALVYVAGFGLDEGESIGALLGQGEPTPALAHIRTDDQGFAWLPQDAFLAHFAPDVDPADANIMYAVQQPLAWSALDDVMGTPAWRNLPSWFAVAQHDEVIPPDAERLFAQRMGATVVELASSHVAMVSHAEEIADLIETAVQDVTE